AAASPSGDQVDVAGQLADAPRPVTGDMDDLLHADAELAGEIDPRLDREDHPLLDRLRVQAGDDRQFVHAEAEPAVDPLNDALSVARLLNYGPGSEFGVH